MVRKIGRKRKRNLNWRIKDDNDNCDRNIIFNFG
jgi:hypothetical protein